MKSSRRDVFNVIEGERAYQDAQRGNAASDMRNQHSLGDVLVFMESYLDKAKAAYSGPWPLGRAEALDIVRKVTALGVYAMELHGAVARS